MRKRLWVLWLILGLICAYLTLGFIENVRYLLTVPFAMVIPNPNMVDSFAFLYSYGLAILAFLTGLFTGLIFVRPRPKLPPPLPEMK
ncbi:hypothetical protein E4H12_01815 [Candidatus Thorarchaeota archaeon]|nr:MAG: hypothetical protein E4H12_01815 [Candidatus Thorarchaeota archaeon]